MADARALLAAERQARRIQHPYLTYTKAGKILCNVCDLNVKSESLWPGHLKSANHRKNAQAVEDKRTKNLKRKLDDVDEDPGVDPDEERDVSKKPKSRVVSTADQQRLVEEEQQEAQAEQDAQQNGVSAGIHALEPELVEAIPETIPPSNAAPEPAPDLNVNDDEFAAFERDIASLDQQPRVVGTITAAPLTAEELARQAEEDKELENVKEVDAEKEEEERRFEEEVEVMEDLGERVRRLKEKREALRLGVGAPADTGQLEAETATTTTMQVPVSIAADEAEEDDDESDVDDWYR